MNHCMKLLASALLCAAATGVAHAETATAPLAIGPRLHIGTPRGVADPVVYDSTGGTFTSTASTPRTFIGGAANITGPGPQVDITSIDVFMVSTAATTYTNIRARIQLWDTYTAASTPIYSNAAGVVISADTGPVTTAANTVSTLTLTLPTPLRLNSLTGKGFAINFQSDTGAGLADDTTLTSALNVNGAQAVGSSAVGGGNGFYRNASARTDFNFIPSDARTFQNITDARTSLVLRGNASVPVSLQSFDVD